MRLIRAYQEKQRLRERVVRVVNERGYHHIVSQIEIDNYKSWHRKDTRFIDALREEYE